MWGNRTACGQTLTPDTIGVAHKTLPCGTPVTFYYNGHFLTARVIDRGPFNQNHSWDLTAAAAQRLGLQQTDSVRSVHLRAGQAARARRR
jgi:rare lipoprotein A